jgi:3'-phosphoadenosine 5'-phosphosulfate sulfotransferase (PAPS reductase)/FAD synthetase
MTNHITQIIDLVQRGALFVVNHSGGKDSQAMTLMLQGLVPAEQMIVVHAELPGVDWDGIIEHINDTVDGLPVTVVKSVKTFIEMVQHRGMFPSPQYRQCTSDLKRNPIEKAVRHHLKAHPEFGGLVVNCMGIRAQESTSRAKAKTFKLNAKNSKAGREWYDWLPIHEMLETEVFEAIEAAGQKAHWAYAAGMSRLSCCFCIMASKSDLVTAAKLAPARFAEMVELEKTIGHTMNMQGKGLEEVTGIAA